MCGQDFKGDSDLFETRIISKACRNTQANVNDDGRHQCDLCPSSYTKKSSLTRHIDWKHTPPQIFKCDVCDKTFYNQYSLKRHKKGLHGVLTDLSVKMIIMLYVNSFQSGE